MKVKDVLRDLGDKVSVQIYKPSPGGYEKQFPSAYHARIVRHHADDVSFVCINMDKEVDHCDYRTISRGRGFENYCDIYLKAEPAVVKTESELDTFFKKLDPDAYVNLRIWYGDPKDGASEFIYVGLSGADYNPASCRFKNFYELFENLEISKIRYELDEGFVLDCVKRRTKGGQNEHKNREY